jgi:hypothetical protein
VHDDETNNALVRVGSSGRSVQRPHFRRRLVVAVLLSLQATPARLFVTLLLGKRGILPAACVDCRALRLLPSCTCGLRSRCQSLSLCRHCAAAPSTTRAVPLFAALHHAVLSHDSHLLRTRPRRGPALIASATARCTANAPAVGCLRLVPRPRPPPDAPLRTTPAPPTFP